jgi:hypothetical protein
LAIACARMAAYLRWAKTRAMFFRVTRAGRHQYVQIARSYRDAGVVKQQTLLSLGRLARIFHRGINQRSGECVQRVELIEPNEPARHRFFQDRL